MDEIDQNALASQLPYDKLIDDLEKAEGSYQKAKAAFLSIQSELDSLFATKPNRHKHALNFVSKEYEKLVVVWEELKHAYLELLPGTTLENFREDCQKACDRATEQEEFAHLSFATKKTAEAILKHAEALATWDDLKEDLINFLEHVSDFNRCKDLLKNAIDEIYNRAQSLSPDQLRTFLEQKNKLEQQGNLESAEEQLRSWQDQLDHFNPDNSNREGNTIAVKIEELYEFINNELYPCYTKVEPQKLIKALLDSIAKLGYLKTEKAAFACWKLYGSDIRAHDRAYKIYESKMTEIRELIKTLNASHQERPGKRQQSLPSLPPRSPKRARGNFKN